MNRDIDSGKRSDKSSTNAKSLFSCENCGQRFNSTRVEGTFLVSTLKIFI